MNRHFAREGSRGEKTVDVEMMVQSSETCVLRLQGRWTIERAHELKDLLMEALKGSDHVLLEMEGLTAADLSCLQLLYSAHRSSLKLGKRLALQGKKPKTFGQVVRDAGFASVLDCL